MMKLPAKIAATVIGTALVSGMAGLAAQSAFADTTAPTPGRHAATTSSKVGSPQYSRGFHIYNLTRFPMQLQSISGDGNYEGRPEIGSIIEPGQSADFEVTYKFMSSQNDEVDYSVGIGDDLVGGFSAFLHVGDGGSSSSDYSNYGVYGGDGSQVLTLRDWAGTNVTIPADQAQRQADTLKQLCAETDQAHCSFTPTSETHVDGPKHVVVTESNNGPNTATLTASKGDSVSSSDSLEVGASAGGQIAGLVNVQVSAKYGHTWGQTHTFTTGVSNPVSPHSFGEITAIAPMIRDTGDFTVTMGNTTWNLTGVCFDSPDTDGAEHFGYDEHPLTPAQVASLPPTAVITTP